MAVPKTRNRNMPERNKIYKWNGKIKKGLKKKLTERKKNYFVFRFFCICVREPEEFFYKAISFKSIKTVIFQ